MHHQHPKQVEAEIKIRTSREQTRARLCAMGARLVFQGRQVDTYFHHPCRNLRAADEAFRLRQTAAGNRLTYKGPRVPGKLKQRCEIEISVSGDVAELLKHLGFSAAVVVVKQRELYLHKELRCAVDSVEKLGEFVEIEAQHGEALQAIASFVDELGLAREPWLTSSYVELLEEV